MFTCSTLHRWVCKSHVSDYSSMLAILRSQSRRDLPVLWRATLVSIHADEISIVIAYTKDTRNPECNYAIYRFIANYCLMILKLIVLALQSRYKAEEIGKVSHGNFFFSLMKILFLAYSPVCQNYIRICQRHETENKLGCQDKITNTGRDGNHRGKSKIDTLEQSLCFLTKSRMSN